MEFQYLKELKKYSVSESDLPEDAKTGIEQLNEIKRAVTMLEKKGKKPTQKTLNKIKAMDKWVCYEIYDFVNDTDENDDDAPFDDDEIIDELEEQDDSKNENSKSVDPKGLKIEAELKSLHESGTNKYDIEDLESVAPVTYDLLFDTYEEGEENGIETSNYSLIEKSDGMFYISKK